MQGISPRYIQDKIQHLVSRQAIEEKSINPFMVSTNSRRGSRTTRSSATRTRRSDYRELLNVVKEEYEDIIKGEVQRAISADEDAIRRLCANYIENVRAYTQKERVATSTPAATTSRMKGSCARSRRRSTSPTAAKTTFRQEIMNYIGALSLDGKKFEYNTNARLYRALELKLFEDQRDTIKLKNLVSSVVDDETQAKIDVVKQRLIKNFGYNETSATDVLNYVASIFARGDSKQMTPAWVRAMASPAMRWMPRAKASARAAAILVSICWKSTSRWMNWPTSWARNSACPGSSPKADIR
jgi:serine protein kinase